MEAAPTLSVITCAHNPRTHYLTTVLAGLRHQTLPATQWEFLLVDNASVEPLTSRFDLGWHPGARHIHEPELGLTPARLRSIREARGDLLVFVDDDNVLDPGFLAQALRVSREWPQLGAWSGKVAPEFETPPPEWTRRYWGMLVVRDLQRPVWSNLPHLPETMPCGAGLCVRRAVAERYLHLHEAGERPLKLDRTGDSLLSAGDNDLGACACDLGQGVGLFPELRLRHLLPASRLEEDYLVRLAEGIEFSTVVFKSFRTTDWSVFRPRLVVRVVDTLRLLRMTRRERRFFRAAGRGRRKAWEFLSQGRA